MSPHSPQPIASVIAVVFSADWQLRFEVQEIKRQGKSAREFQTRQARAHQKTRSRQLQAVLVGTQVVQS